ncbi:MAG TPA: SDR family NAD(P)-dependent oxidoreductase [Micromonosporaceae bacterium]|nr:SDR family NAD(P)-dependent oxidoreductase [Micromonosporaceae bacterium]
MYEQPVREHDIAVIGMAGRFPGAPDIPTLWENLRNGVESFTEITDEDIANAGYHGYLASHPGYVRVRPVLDDIKGFDAQFFGYSPREAAIADPQQRIFLECVHEALEGAGYGRPGERGRVGIFAGDNMSMYMTDRFNDPETLLRIDPYELVIGNDKDALTTVVAYRLDLTGPAVAVQTFCSTSAVAIHLACQSLRRNECEMAIAGGVCIRVPDRIGYIFVEGGMTSPDGHIRTFDAKAQGGIFGDGSAAILLKPLRQAIADRDTVLAVIRGSAMNNDGAAKFSYTAPSVVGQSAAVAAALADADVAPRDVSYVEAHGTATELGDPIEIAALTRAFRTAETARSGAELRDRQYCAVGSVKTNIGHLDRAATVAGFIKVVEAMRHELIPKSLNYESPNPEIDFARSPFYVAGDPVPWPRQSGRPRVAGLNGLGMGGTNVHIVLQEAPDLAPRKVRTRSWQVLPVSAKSENAASNYCENMAAHLVGDHGQDLGDIAYTLQVGRALLPHRRVVVTQDAESAAAAFGLRATPGANLLTRHSPVKGTRTSFLFAGVGEHYTGMVAELYRTEPSFRHYLDEGQRLLTEAASIEVVSLLIGERESSGTNDLAALLGRRPGSAPAASPFSDTRVAQTGVFLAEYALARTLMDWGITPDLVLGYSVGEYVAACLAGVLTLPDAVRLVAHRANLIAGMPTGAMLAVGKTWEELTALQPDLAERDIDLAAITPGQVVVGGPTEAVAELAGWLRQHNIVCRELDTTHAFHTRMLEPVAAELTKWIEENITLHAPTMPYVSNVTGELATAELVTDPGYWAEHMCRPVQFTACLAAALKRTGSALLEIGPGRSLGAMARSHPDCDRSRWPLIIPTVPGAGEDGASGARALATALAELWLTGVDIDWPAYHQTDQAWRPGRVPLPTYPFERQSYWFTQDMAAGTAMVEAGQTKSRDELFNEYETLPLLPERQWLNLPVWRERAPKPPMPDPGTRWVVFTDEGRADAIAGPLIELLAIGDAQVTLVRPGTAFAEDGDGYRIRPGNIEDTLDLFIALKERGCIPDRVVHMWTLAEASVTDTVRRGLHTLVAIARAAHEVGFGDWKLDVVTSGTFQVTGDEPIVPARATSHGPCTILPVEYAGAAIRIVDLRDDAPAPAAEVLAELRTDPANQVIALRGGRRWSPDFEILELAGADEELPEPVAPFRTGGVYLVTGGLGGIGMALAERVADTYGAKLVLFGRTPVPSRDRWDAILGDPSASAEVRRRIEGLRHFEAKAIEFELVAGDVADVEAVRRAVEAAKTRFGALHGVLHAAGVPAVGMMQFKTVDDMDRVLAPKVGGTLALAEVLRDEPLDFLVLFSSVASWTGALGQADYSSANSFLDAFARSGALPQAKVVSIGWGEWTWNGWAEGLEGYEPVLRELYIHHRKVFGIDFDAGWRCLRQILSRPEPYLVVNTQDFAASVEGSRNYTIHDLQAGARKGRGEDRYPRPELSTPYIAPSNETETAIADTWGEWIGIDQVGIHDNFFDLGGNSMIGVGVMDAIRRALDLDHLPAHLLYQAPTVSALALAVADTKAQPTKQESGGETRAAQRQQRLARRRANVRGTENE